MPRFILLILGLTMVISAAAQPGRRNIRQEITWLKNALLQQHVEPKTIDDAFSGELFDKLLHDLDPDRIFFTQADIAWLEPYRNLLDDDINGKDTGFFNRLKERYRTSLERSQNLIHSVLRSPVDWKKAEIYDPGADWAKDEPMLSDRHRQWLKYEILERLTDILDRDSIAGDDFFEKNLAGATDYVLITTLRPITRMLKDPVAYDHELATVFMQAMAHLFDPHSDFFSADDFEDFMAAMSTEDYYFGFTLGEDGKGNIIISALAPGGAAWKSGALHVSDVVLAVQWVGEERIDLAGMNIEDVNVILSAQNDDVIEMTVRTVEGTEKQVILRKEKLEAEQNVVQSFILNGNAKTGYIYLPDFYTRWDDEQQGGRCANDVAKEIIKLKREGIEGLILDLRFNGGGSLHEARAMAGIFIDEGPLVVVSTRDQKGVTLKDMNRGTIYDGPLVIMVNGASASASEVLAATIQDYNRGLIVGSKTYGKATGQNIFPLAGPAAEKSSKKAAAGSAYVKITTQRLYRVTGKSTQAGGVVPDVVLPDIFAALGVHESKDRFALQQDSIIKNTYYKPMKPLSRKLFQERSRERVSTHPVFLELRETIKWLEDRAGEDPGIKSLSWEEYLNSALKQKNKQTEAKENVVSPGVIYEVTNTLTKEERLTLDDYARTINDRWLGILATDIYLQETYHILTDYIHDTKKL
jgi:carboxyl-terminal processing protease